MAEWKARIIAFTEEQWHRGVVAGTGRRNSAIRNERKNRNGNDAKTPEEHLRRDIYAAQGELAASIATGLPWVGEEIYHERIPAESVDIGKRIDVKTTDCYSGHLIVQENSPDDFIYVLVIYDIKRKRFLVIGWLYGWEAKKLGEWKKERPNGWAWFVNMKHMHDLSTLPEKAGMVELADTAALEAAA